MLVISVVIALLVGVSYLASVPAVYTAQLQVRPADDPRLVWLNDTGKLDLDRGHAFLFGLRTLESNELRQSLLSQNPEFRGEIGQLLVQMPVAVRGTAVTRDYTIVSLKGVDPETVASALNMLLATANESAAASLIARVESALDSEIELLEQRIAFTTELNRQAAAERIVQLGETLELQRLQLEDRIEALRQRNLALRSDRLDQLREALELARSLKFDEPLDAVTQYPVGSPVAAEGRMGGTEFLLGTRILQAQINALEGRENDDFTDPEIRELQAQLFLNSQRREAQHLQLHEDEAPFTETLAELQAQLEEKRLHRNRDFSGLRVLKVDRAATADSGSPGSRYMTLLLLFTFAGFFLGVFIAMMKIQYQRQAAARLRP